MDSRYQLSAFELLGSGAIAGAVGKTVTAPIDRVKILYQVNPERAFSLARGFKTLKKITANSGTEGLFRGNGAAMWRVVPHSAIVFTTFDKYEGFIKEVLGGRKKDIYSRFVAGAAAGATATVLTYPFDLLRARMAAHWNMTPKYRGYMHGIQEISRKEGPKALFRGMSPTLLGILPYAGVSFATFGTLKGAVKDHLGFETDNDIPVLIRLACGGVAGLVSQTISYPIHVVRRRMQVQPELYKGTWEALAKIYRYEGIAGGLFKGVALTWVKAPIATAVTFCINDFLKSRLNLYHEELEKGTIDINVEFPSLKGQRDQTVEGAGKGISTIEQMMAGGAAGAIAKTVIAPGDRVKILYQVNPDRKFTMRAAWKTATQIVVNNGAYSLWRGNMATLMRIVPHAAVGYVTFDKAEGLIQQVSGEQQKTPFTRFVAGAVAGATATMVSYPFDLLRARMAAHWGIQRPYEGYFGAITSITGKEGPLALYHGLKPTLLGVLPYSGTSFMTFETLKASLKTWMGLKTDKEIPTYIRLVCGAVAGLVAQSLTYPLDIVRRRMQVSGGTLEYRGVLHALTSIYGKEGWHGLYKGLAMNWIKGPIAVAVSFTANDMLKDMFRRGNQLQPHPATGPEAAAPTAHTGNVKRH